MRLICMAYGTQGGIKYSWIYVLLKASRKYVFTVNILPLSRMDVFGCIVDEGFHKLFMMEKWAGLIFSVE